MKTSKLFLSIAVLIALASCGKSKSVIESSSASPSTAENTQTGITEPAPVSNSATEKLLSEIETTLLSEARSGQLPNMSEQQISEIFDEVSHQLAITGLLQSEDLKKSLPEVLKAFTSNSAFLNLDQASMGQLLGVLGQGSIQSVLGQITNSTETQALLQLITSELITDLPQTGASINDFSSIAQILVGRLTSQVQNSNIQQFLIPIFLQAISNGSASGLDQLSQLGLDKNLLTNIAQNILNGFVAGQATPQQFLVQQLIQLLISKLVK